MVVVVRLAGDSKSVQGPQSSSWKASELLDNVNKISDEWDMDGSIVGDGTLVRLGIFLWLVLLPVLLLLLLLLL